MAPTAPLFSDIFFNLSVTLGITAVIAFVVRSLRQPMLVAYLVAGIVVGPFFFGATARGEELMRAFADIGVVLLLFVVGLSMNVRHVREVGKSAVIAGVGQFLFTAVFGLLLLLALALPLRTALYLAIAVTFSSTIIIVKLLAEQRATDRVYGRQVLGLMVVQDLIAMALIVGVSVLGGAANIRTVIEDLALRGGIVLVGIVLVARFVLPRVLDRAAQSAEHLFMTTVTWCFVVASAMAWAGFSLEVGALAAGVVLATSPYQPEIASRIRPLRDFFLVLFFVILGSTMRFDGIATALVPAIALSTFVIVGCPAILYAIYRRLHFTRRDSFLAGLSAAQVSEFGFVLVLAGIAVGHIGADAQAIFTLTAIVTIIASTYLIEHGEALFDLLRPILRRFGTDGRAFAQDGNRYDVWVFGYHRIGWKVVDRLREGEARVAVVDDNPRSIAKIRERGLPEFFGDAGDVDFLDALPLDGARMIISTIPDLDTQATLMEHVRRRLGARVRIIATSEHARELPELYAAGADFVAMPHLLGGTWLADVLCTGSQTKETFRTLRRAQAADLERRSFPATTR